MALPLKLSTEFVSSLQMIVRALFVLQRKIDLRIPLVYQLKLSLTHKCQNPTIGETLPTQC